jgi:steroid delta-isomerase-like uncharacterized protein
MQVRSWFLYFTIAVVVGSGELAPVCATSREQRVGNSNSDRNRALVRRWVEQGFNKREVTVVDELFISDVVVNGQRVGRAGLMLSMRRFITAFPDLRVTITDVVAEGDKVVIWYAVQGTQAGEFEGIAPTQKQVRWSGADLFRFENGRIVECRFLDDSLGLIRQLGATISLPR